jgi:hypothetical protein
MTRRLEEINKEESIVKDGDDGNINVSQSTIEDTIRAKDANNDSVWANDTNDDCIQPEDIVLSEENQPEDVEDAQSIENHPPASLELASNRTLHANKGASWTNEQNVHDSYVDESICNVHVQADSRNQIQIHSQILKISKGCSITEEKKHLLPYRPPLELAVISENTVDSYSMITVDTCKYSVPEYFVGKKVTVKKYHDEIRVYAKGSHARDSIGIDADNIQYACSASTASGRPASSGYMICSHKRIFGAGNMSVDIYHYLGTLLRKPGAVRNSVALKRIPKLKAIFDTHYAKEPKKFIEIFIEHKELSVDEIMLLFEERTSNRDTMRAEMKAISITGKPSSADVVIRADMVKYTALIYNAGIGRKEVNAGVNAGIECKVAGDGVVDGVVENTMDNYVENDRIFNPLLSLPPLSAPPIPPPTSSLSPPSSSSFTSSAPSSASSLSALPLPPSLARGEVVAHASNS